MRCIGCNIYTGTHVLCDFCRRTTKQSHPLWSKATKLWHELVVGKNVQCSYCRNVFRREMLCGEHIKGKGAFPELRFDVLNGTPACMRCNQSDIKQKYLNNEK